MTSLTYGSANRGSAARSQRAFVFATIAGLHAVVIALIVSGFGKVAMEMVTHEMKATVLPPVTLPERPTTQPHDPVLTRVVVPAVPPPEINIPIEDDGDGAITVPFQTAPPPSVVVDQPAPPPVRLVGQHRLPNTDIYYPAKDIRDEVEGSSTVGVCVDANGRRTGEPTVVQSSGSASLDAGAIRVLRDGRYARAMQGDQYVPNCYQFRIVFKIRRP